ncbi:DUF4142 domain-containing protein [Rhodopila sp.]|jgi:putative membrane protein|uniref:DUF4142 domain-containing protein n=1 Tax=Rhodopila sp. TaxID=2480087 RepID=UPI002B78D773|nr:DUF4142 domain-containing protein [Rhodopila sp.]HVZ10010.1 DUF4142 domain-containing protein [Rhodopila sp.]
MRTLITTLAAATLLSATPALAAVSGSDRTFAAEAAQGGVAEIQLGQLALQKAASPQVKEFANRMVTDHTTANQELAGVAKTEKLSLPAEPDARQKSDMERLSGLTGNAFDTAYMKQMVQDHEKTVAAFQKEAQTGRDPELKAFAQKYLPVLRQHLQMAQASQTKG